MYALSLPIRGTDSYFPIPYVWEVGMLVDSPLGNPTVGQSPVYCPPT